MPSSTCAWCGKSLASRVSIDVAGAERFVCSRSCVEQLADALLAAAKAKAAP